MALFITIDPNAPHDEDCDWWHGFFCKCKPEARRALEIAHCNECDFMHGSGDNRCNCDGNCLYPDESYHKCSLDESATCSG